jgi:hypothetical protein
VSFEESTEVFLDHLQLSMPDHEHGKLEDCFITLGNNRAHKLQLASIPLGLIINLKSLSVLFQQGQRLDMNKNNMRTPNERRI